MLRHACGYALASKGPDTPRCRPPGPPQHPAYRYTELAPGRSKGFWKDQDDQRDRLIGPLVALKTVLGRSISTSRWQQSRQSLASLNLLKNQRFVHRNELSSAAFPKEPVICLLGNLGNGRSVVCWTTFFKGGRDAGNFTLLRCRRNGSGSAL